MSKKAIITGTTGSGKTYYTIHEAKKLGRFAYIAPCRQLAYEVYIDYAQQYVDHLSTGEVKLDGNGGDMYAVYESLDIDSLEAYDSIVIDEAHYITDDERGGHLSQIVENCKKMGINIFLVTATRNFPKWRGWEFLELQPRFTPPEKVEVSYSEYLDRMNRGIPTIEFKKYKSDAMLSADTLPSDRLKLQLDYRSGRIKYVSATNVLAQGINMPCENLYIEYNPYDPAETIEQKLGRLGRLGFTDSSVVTYHATAKKKIKKNKKKAKKKNREVCIQGWGDDIKVNEHEVPKWINDYVYNPVGYIQYKQIRYAKPFLVKAARNNLTSKQREFVDYSLDLLKQEEESIKKIIMQYKH